MQHAADQPAGRRRGGGGISGGCSGLLGNGQWARHLTAVQLQPGVSVCAGARESPPPPPRLRPVVDRRGAARPPPPHCRRLARWFAVWRSSRGRRSRWCAAFPLPSRLIPTCLAARDDFMLTHVVLWTSTKREPGGFLPPLYVFSRHLSNALS